MLLIGLWHCFLCLGRLRFLGKVLKVERAAANNDKPSQASNNNSISVNPTSKPSLVHNPTIKIEADKVEVSRSEPIAPRLGVDYPFPPHLEYVIPLHFFKLLKHILLGSSCICEIYLYVC